MWPLRKHSIGTPNPSDAIAYLKVAVPPDDGFPAIDLAYDDMPVLTDIGNSLLIAYVVDSADSFTYVQHRDISRADVTEAQLRQTGINNLAAIVQKGNLRVAPHPTNEIFAVFLDGNFEASLVLLDTLWDNTFRQFVKGDYVAAIPARDVLAFCDSESVVGKRELRTIIDKLKATNDHPLLHELLVRRHGQWIPENMA